MVCKTVNNIPSPYLGEGVFLFLKSSKLVVGNTKAFLLGKDISFSDHTHSTSQITSGVLPIARGGTGVSSLSALKSALDINNSCTINVGSYIGNGSDSTNINISSGHIKACIVYQISGDSDQVLSPLIMIKGLTNYRGTIIGIGPDVIIGCFSIVYTISNNTITFKSGRSAIYPIRGSASIDPSTVGYNKNNAIYGYLILYT